MIYLPPLRRYLLPAIASVSLIILLRGFLLPPDKITTFISHSPLASNPAIRVPVSAIQKPLPLFKSSENHLTPPNNDYYYNAGVQGRNNSTTLLSQSILDPNLAPLFECSRSANAYTDHIRLSSILQNISMIPPSSTKSDSRIFWNPTIIALPHWSENQYLLVSRILTDGNHQENVLCEANICHVESTGSEHPREQSCSPEDIKYLGSAGGMRCASPPVKLSVPPTPAAKCEGKFGTYVDIPGFHDPRIFWSGKGEPLMMVNTQSRYACFGLWMIDLRSLYPRLQKLLSSSPTRLYLGPLKSYPTLTELTRNPPSSRVSIEKNWLLFFPPNGESYIQYELPSRPKNDTNRSITRGRTFAKLLGNGLTTTNLTDPREQPCPHDLLTSRKRNKPLSTKGTWHQATNSLRLILCNRADPKCNATPEKTVFFALIHRKFPNDFDLPLRYERFFIVWSATPPFEMLAISAHPILLFNETATGWSAAHNWADNDNEQDGQDSKLVQRSFINSTKATPSGDDERPLWAYFTYTVSMAYAWGRQPKATRGKNKGHEDKAEDMHVGYLDDEVVLGIGVDDKGQAFSRVKAGDLVSCMRACPGRTEVKKTPDDA